MEWATMQEGAVRWGRASDGTGGSGSTERVTMQEGAVRQSERRHGGSDDTGRVVVMHKFYAYRG